MNSCAPIPQREHRAGDNFHSCLDLQLFERSVTKTCLRIQILLIAYVNRIKISNATERVAFSDLQTYVVQGSNSVSDVRRLRLATSGKKRSEGLMDARIKDR